MKDATRTNDNVNDDNDGDDHSDNDDNDNDNNDADEGRGGAELTTAAVDVLRMTVTREERSRDKLAPTSDNPHKTPHTAFLFCAHKQNAGRTDIHEIYAD